MIDEPFSPEEIARQLDETRTGATLSVGPLGDWLRKKKLVRKNPRTGWFDTTVRARWPASTGRSRSLDHQKWNVMKAEIQPAPARRK